MGLAGATAIAAGLAVGCSRDAGSAASGRGRSPQAMPVAAAEVAPRDLTRSVTVTAPIEALRVVPVNSQTSGTLLQLRVEEGDRVRAGDLMAELDARETLAQLGRAEAVLANAEAAFLRAEQLQAHELASAAEVDVLRSAFQVAKADVELWRTRLAFCRIAAPVSGVVTEKNVERGATVSDNQTLFAIAEDALLVARVRVSELDVVHLDGNRPVSIRLDAYPDSPLNGRIRRVFPSADPASRLVPVEVALDPLPEGVAARPGFLARVTFTLDSRSGVLAVPAAAIGVSEFGSFVYVVAADTLSRRPVETGMTTEGWIEVTSGLAAGERVVSSGHVNLSQGTRVRVSGAPAGGAPR